MLTRIKETWRQFKAGKPGQRFQEQYRRRQKENQGRWDARKLFHIIAGTVIALIGSFFIPAPGPGTLIMALGLGLIGSEFRPLARALDWAEVKVRTLLQECKAIWARSSTPVKILISLIIVSCMAGAGYGGYHIFFGHPSQ